MRRRPLQSNAAALGAPLVEPSPRGRPRQAKCRIIAAAELEQQRRPPDHPHPVQGLTEMQPSAAARWFSSGSEISTPV